MVKCYLSKILGERRLKMADVIRDTGLSRGTITRLYHEQATRIEFEVVEKLCSYLDCKIQDILEVIPSDDVLPE